MLVSVLLPTHNRPELLKEALRSVAAQSSPAWELVVVDDGSTPRVAPQTVRSIVGERFRLVRNEPARGIAGAKNAGLPLAGGDVIVHLDDDDLLAPHAVASIAAAFSACPELDCLFVNVTAFGRKADYANESQQKALERLLGVAAGQRRGELILFDRRLVLALLLTVPWPFQRPAATRGTWRSIGALPDDVSLPEPEWALYAATNCRTGLLLDPVYRVRADGQGYASRPSNWMSHLESGIRTRERFRRYLARRRHDEGIAELRKAARRAHAAALASKAYYCTREEIRPAAAFGAAAASFAIRPSVAAAKLMAKSVLVGARARS